MKFTATYKATVNTDEGTEVPVLPQDQLIYFTVDGLKPEETKDPNETKNLRQIREATQGFLLAGGGDGGALSGGGSGGGESNQSVPRIMVADTQRF